MINRHSILCPVDFSDTSSAALRHAAAIADHFAAQLIVLTVDDPSWAAGLELETMPWPPREERERDLKTYVHTALEGVSSEPSAYRYEAATGKPATEILRAAREYAVDLIVIGSHGRTGVRKLLFGSTTERVLRETTVPVLVTSADRGPVRFEDLLQRVGRIVVPVDFSPGAQLQARIAFGLASSLRLPVTLLHVLELVARPIAGGSQMAALEAERQRLAKDQLYRIATEAPGMVDVIVTSGNPAEEIARLVRDTQAGLVVMALRGASWPGPRVGSVTYRVLCHSPALVLALPGAITAP